MVRVKVCGIRSLEEALAAVEAGADAIGFVFAESERMINPEKAREISKALPPFISRVGVFVNQERYEVQELASFCDLDVLQLHGDETPQYCQKLHLRVIKAFDIKDKNLVQNIATYKSSVAAILLNSYSPSQREETAEPFDWSLATEVKQYGPVILSGGLNSANIEQAILQVQPFGIDVSSGVEHEERKSPQLLENFFAQLRRV